MGTLMSGRFAMPSPSLMLSGAGIYKERGGRAPKLLGFFEMWKMSAPVNHFQPRARNCLAIKLAAFDRNDPILTPPYYHGSGLTQPLEQGRQTRVVHVWSPTVARRRFAIDDMRHARLLR